MASVRARVRELGAEEALRRLGTDDPHAPHRRTLQRLAEQQAVSAGFQFEPDDDRALERTADRLLDAGVDTDEVQGFFDVLLSEAAAANERSPRRLALDHVSAGDTSRWDELDQILADELDYIMRACRFVLLDQPSRRGPEWGRWPFKNT